MDRAGGLQVALGLALGAGIAEGAFYARDGGAFPHLNVYEADARLGVRLRPYARQRFALHDNPPSEIRINSVGLRGDEPKAPTPGEVLVLGDSQVFGLGVEEHQTFAAQLAQLSRRAVVNAGVPTYGPLEYNALAEALLRSRRPSIVVFTVNMLNDLFEHARPNRDRHRVWDGWAVRTETAPGELSSFPGREWLFGRSHAVFALRRFLHERDRAAVSDSFASEGDTHDLLSEATVRSAKAAADQARQRTRESELVSAQTALEEADSRLLHVRMARSQTGEDYETFSARRSIRQATPLAEASPGDIVRERYSESARSIVATAELIRTAARVRDQALAVLARGREREQAALNASIQERSAARARVRALRAELNAARPPLSVLAPELRALQALCMRYGAQPVVVALPIDVQVSSEEWRKYGQKPIDMSATLALTEDVLADARALRMRTLDALPALRGAEPGAFLNGDIHMTAKGHAAVARALAALLSQPAPAPEPDPGLPAGRSYPPNPVRDEDFVDALDIEGQEDAGCTVYALDEWLVLRCGGDTDASPRVQKVAILEGGRGEAVIVRWHVSALVRAPVLPGDVLRVSFEHEQHNQVVRAERKPDGAFAVTFEARTRKPPDARADPQPDPSSALCACLVRNTDGYRDRCDRHYSPERPDCVRSFGSDCEKLEWCLYGNPDALPVCEPGSVRGDPNGRCLPLCGKDGACSVGRCERWQGVDVCRPPS